MFPILLASASPRRRQLLEQVGFCVTVHAVDVDETHTVGEAPDEMARRLARVKATACLQDLEARGGVAEPGAPSAGIAADTVVWTDRGQAPLGKPADRDDAKRMLRELSGGEHNVTTGFCLFDVDDRSLVADQAVTTRVQFRALSERDIDAYVATGEPDDKAGGYGIQGLGAVLVRNIVGSYPNVVGLPVEDVVCALRDNGFTELMPWEQA